jgi:methionine aminopeptidase
MFENKKLTIFPMAHYGSMMVATINSRLRSERPMTSIIKWNKEKKIF